MSSAISPQDAAQQTEGFVLEYRHEAYRPSKISPKTGRVVKQTTRTTYVLVYTQTDYDAWREQQRAIRTLVEDNPHLVIDSRTVRVRKPDPILTGWATCDLVTRNRRTGKPDNFVKAEGRRRATESIHKELNQLKGAMIAGRIQAAKAQAEAGKSNGKLVYDGGQSIKPISHQQEAPASK